jgi:hypothetical protein
MDRCIPVALDMVAVVVEKRVGRMRSPPQQADEKTGARSMRRSFQESFLVFTTDGAEMEQKAGRVLL